jgi:hypothetical protein
MKKKKIFPQDKKLKEELKKVILMEESASMIFLKKQYSH